MTDLMNLKKTDPDEKDKIFLIRAFRAFTKYNDKKTKFLYEELPPRKKMVFNLIPLLLHIDAVGLLGGDDICRMSPHGIFRFQLLPEAAQHFAEAFSGNRLPAVNSKVGYDLNMPIQSVSLMGSLGSIAQSPKSDFDYWIAYDSADIKSESLVYFKEKLRAIEKWAHQLAGAEVHFFPLDLNKILINDFGAVTGESSGSAQGKLLKEEYYRTMTLICGKMPLWWIMPPGVNDEDYSRLKVLSENINRLDPTVMADLGNVANISLGEFYGAALWQINKTMGSPFKSVLKMALLEEYMFNHGSRGLLCTELKEKLLSNKQNMDMLDPYVLMMDRASTYLTEQNRLAELDLLRRSFYLKANPRLTLTDHRKKELPRKKKLLVNLIREWGWNHGQVEKLNNYQNWGFRESQVFNQEINAFMTRTYKNVSSELNQQKDQVGLTISQRDMTVLGRKLYIFYSKRTNKIEFLKHVIEDPPVLNGLTMQPYFSNSGERVWGAFRGMLSREAVATGVGISALLKNSPYLTEVLIWLITNQLYDADTTINLNHGQNKLISYCTVPDLQNLLKGLREFFPPIKLSDLKEQDLLQKPRVAKMFVVINLEESDQNAQIVNTGVCYRNTWGEVFFKGYDQSEDGLKIARNFIRKNFAYDPLGAMANLRIFLPDRQFKKTLAPRLDKFFGIKLIM